MIRRRKVHREHIINKLEDNPYTTKRFGAQRVTGILQRGYRRLTTTEIALLVVSILLLLGFVVAVLISPSNMGIEGSLKSIIVFGGTALGLLLLGLALGQYRGSSMAFKDMSEILDVVFWENHRDNGDSL